MKGGLRAALGSLTIWQVAAGRSFLLTVAREMRSLAAFIPDMANAHAFARAISERVSRAPSTGQRISDEIDLVSEKRRPNPRGKRRPNRRRIFPGVSAALPQPSSPKANRFHLLQETGAPERVRRGYGRQGYGGRRVYRRRALRGLNKSNSLQIKTRTINPAAKAMR